MRVRVIVIGTLIILIILFVLACSKAGLWLVKKDELNKGDAIVILMGSVEDRVFQAMDLYNKGFARRLILVETKSPDIKGLRNGKIHRSITQQTRNKILSLGVPSDSIIILEGGAESTLMESEIIRDYLKLEPDIDTLLLVSSSKHTRRASIIFETVFLKADIEVEVLCSPSIYTKFNAQRWWNSKSGIKIVLSEYLKIIYFRLLQKPWI